MATIIDKCLAMDLEVITRNMVTKAGWSQDRASKTEEQYRRFLFLCAKYKNELIPTDDLDSYWEMHIMDTRKYAHDTQDALGFFLHHTPNILERDKRETRETLRKRFDRTKEVFQLEFGIPMENAVMSGCDDCIPDYDPPNPGGGDVRHLGMVH